MKRIALIGGTGAATLVPQGASTVPLAATAWGAPSGSARAWTWHRVEVIYLPRHGVDGAIAPHRVNYRANIQALRDLNPDAVIGINTVGGITPAAWPGRVVVPEQIIDYTFGRAHTFFDGAEGPLRHIEFDPPFALALRAQLTAAASAAGIDALTVGTYGVTQGPRLETAAEVDRIAADGCDIVGMTAMPEAALAREADLDYAICAAVVNRAAGRLPPGESIHGELNACLDRGMGQIRALLERFFA